MVACLVFSVIALVMPRASRDAVAAALRGSVLAPLVSLESRAVGVRAAIASRSDVLQLRGDVALQALSTRGVLDENATLRGLIGLGARLHDGFVAADVLPSRNAEEARTLRLNVGTAAGVVPYSAVVTADGLVGMVMSADENTSVAITWAHPDFAVSAVSVDQGALGIVKPHLGGGVERWLLELRGVPFRSKLDTGTVIVSSGLGSTYPRGIKIGTVLGEIATPEKWARTYLIRPAVLPAAIGPVLVLRPERAARGVNGVWTNVASADSAARAIAAAGDSIGRRAALDELLARRAALDSAALDSATLDSATTLSPGRSAPRVPVRAPRADSAAEKKPTRPDTLRVRPPTGPPPLAVRPGPPPLSLP